MKQVLCIILLLVINVSVAQSIQILNAENNQPISGVAVFNESMSKSVVSNKLGFVDLAIFSINFSKNVYFNKNFWKILIK